MCQSTCASKNDMSNLTNFHPRALESLKVATFMGSSYPKYKMYELKIYRGVICHDNEE